MSKRGIYGNQLSKFQVKHMWTDEDKRIAASMAGKYPIQDIAKKLGRTKNAVAKQLGKLGFKWKHPDNEDLAA